MARSIDEALKLTLGDLLARNTALATEVEQLREALAQYQAQAQNAKTSIEAS